MNSNVIIKNIQPRKRLTAVFTVLAMLAAFVFIPGVTLADTGNIEVILKAEAGISESNTLEVGLTKSMKVPNLYDASSNNRPVATVKFTRGSSANNLSVTGVSAGVAVVAYGTNSGTVSSERYQITDSSNISEFTLTGGGKVYFDEAVGTKPIPMTVAEGKGDIKTVTWKSHDTSVATVDSKSGAITAVDDGVTTILGEFTDKWGTPRIVKVVALVGHSKDNSLGGGGIVDKGDLIDGGNGNWYRPVGKPPHVYEVVDEDGKSNVPPQYIYNPGDEPGDENDREAEKDGNNYYVENPANIWTPVGPDGNLNEDGAIWGGPNGKPGGGDDMPVVNFDGEYWVDMGQNVWKKVMGPYELGPLTGGGPDLNPATDPVIEIYDYTANDGRYYVGPLVDAEGDEYYHGDSNLYNRNGTLDSTAEMLHGDDMVYYMDKAGNMVTKKPEKDMSEAPTLVGNNLIPPSFTGDTVDWMEIARNGSYSLIVRTKYINYDQYAEHRNILNWQTTTFGSNSTYGATSLVRSYINNWFEGKATGEADNLRKEARIRKFTMQNNAPDMLGTSDQAAEDSLIVGFSKPTTIQIPSGSKDVAFALSYGEVSNFLSDKHNEGASVVDSAPLARANFSTLKDNTNNDLSGYGIWLRSPGVTSGTHPTATYRAGILDFSQGRAYQENIDNSGVKGLVYPALWVRTAILEDKTMYKAVEGKKNIYELLNEFGTPKTYPASYIYSTDEKPAIGTRLPAIYNGSNCYVEIEAGSNIWVYVKEDGSLNYEKTIWGGPSGKPSGDGDKLAKKFGDSYWITVGQNIWQKITGKTLGPYMAGGIDRNPTTDPESKVQESGGNYYVGPIQPNGTVGIVHYYGAKTKGDEVMSTSTNFDSDTDKVYYYDNGMMFGELPTGGCTTMGDGRTIAGSKIGDDGSDWIEIAKNGEYALIVRKEALKWSGTQVDIKFSMATTPSTDYSSSDALKTVNKWFRGELAAPNQLPGGAKLRSYTMTNNAKTNQGAFYNLETGFSKPGTPFGTGDDIAFLLSYSEVVRYLSKAYATNDLSGADKASNGGAISNFIEFGMNNNETMWLRTANTYSTRTVGTLNNKGEVSFTDAGNYGTMHPALWVKSSIFDL